MDDFEESSGGEEGAPAWMATFADMVSLLLTFFILLLSFANMDIVKFREMMGSMKEAFGYQKEFHGNYNPELLVVDPPESAKRQAQKSKGDGHSEEPQMDLRLLKQIQRVIAEQKIEESVQADASNRGVVIRVRDQLMFKAGSDRLLPPAYVFLDEVSKLIGRFPYRVLIEGHTDNSPIRTRRFPSNWELSVARAIAVMRYLAEVGGIEHTRLGTAGYADTRPIESNDTAEGRMSNRRVEFVCHRDAELGSDVKTVNPEQVGVEEVKELEAVPQVKPRRKGRRKGKNRRRRR